MSFNGVRRRAQKNIEKLPKALRASFLKQQNKTTLPTFESTIPPVPRSERKHSVEQIGFTAGDLAYVTTGEHKGTVSTIFQYSPELDAFLLADVTEKRLLPKDFWVANQQSHVMDYPKYIPRDHVKLAAKDRDDNGNVHYVVADGVEFKEKYYDERYKKWLPKRYVKHHSSIEIPWPNPPQEAKDGELSTTEETVLEKTFELQSLAIPPIPKEALAQLRNPYSKHKSKALSEAQARRLNGPDMPLSKEQRIYLAKKAAEPKKDVKDLTDEMKDAIGQRIADHLNKIDNPSLLAHLDALSKTTNPNFQKTMKIIEETQALNQ